MDALFKVFSWLYFLKQAVVLIFSSASKRICDDSERKGTDSRKKIEGARAIKGDE